MIHPFFSISPIIRQLCSGRLVYASGLRARINIIFALLLFCLPANSQTVSQSENIRLQVESMPFTPKEYYIAGIIDERKDRKAVVYLLNHTDTSPAAAATRPVDLEGGGLAAIRQYIKQSLPQNKKFRPVTIRLKECLITESAADKGRIAGKATISMSFEWQREGEIVSLIDYNGGAQYTRSANQLAAVLQYEFKDGLNRYLAKTNGQVKSLKDLIASSLVCFLFWMNILR